MPLFNFSPPDLSVPKRNFLGMTANGLTVLRCAASIGDVVFMGGDSGRLARVFPNNFLQSTPRSAQMQGMTAYNNRLITFHANDGFYTSDDLGVTFTQRQALVATLSGMAAKAGVVFAQQSGSPTAWRSTDNGQTWGSFVIVAGGSGNAATNQFVKYYLLDNIFIRLPTGSSISTSTDGVTWTNIATGLPSGSFISQNYFKGYYYFGSTTGFLYRSNDLVTFAQVPQAGLYFNRLTDNTPGQHTGIYTFNDDQYITSNFGQIMWSNDGLTYEACPSSISSNLTTGLATDNYFYLSSGTSTVLRSLAF